MAAPRKFTIEIEIGNSAMMRPHHVAAAVEKISKQLPHVIMLKGQTVKIQDENGNTVGFWKYE